MISGLDIVIAAVSLVIIIRAYLKGFIKEIFCLGGLVLAIAVAVRFQSVTQKMLEQAIGINSYNFIIAFIILFAGVIIIVAVIGILLSKLVSVSPLGGLNRVLGLFIGIVKSAIITTLGVFLLVMMIGTNSSIIANSKIAPYAIKISGWTLGHLPEQINNSLSKTKKALDETKILND